MGCAETEANTNEEGGDFKMARASLHDLKATPIVARWSNHRKGVGFAFRTLTEQVFTLHNTVTIFRVPFNAYLFTRNTQKRRNTNLNKPKELSPV